MIRVVNIQGRRFTVDEEDTCVHDLFWSEVEAGRWEPHTFKVLDRFLGPGKILLDVGAWLGAISLYAGALGAECYSFEPDPVAFQMLLRNVLANPDFNVRPSGLAIADRPGMLKLGSMGGLGSSMTSVTAAEKPFFSNCCTLSQAAGHAPHIDLVKIDVEGAEALVLSDMRFFELHRPAVLISLHPHLAPCSLAELEKLYGSSERVAEDTYLLEAA